MSGIASLLKKKPDAAMIRALVKLMVDRPVKYTIPSTDIIVWLQDGLVDTDGKTNLPGKWLVACVKIEEVKP